MFLENLKNKKIILASKSPRRKELLEGLHINFEIKVSDVEENFPSHLKNEEIAVYLAEKKANAMSLELDNDTVIIAADTLVFLGDKILEKPKDEKSAFEMLSFLSGKKHQVISGVCVLTKNKSESFYDITDVYFKELTQKEINFYIQKYKPFDKAGSYGIQEWIGFIGIEKINGSYFNVMGLPLFKLQNVLEKI